MAIEFSVNVYVNGDIQYGDSFSTLEEAKQYLQKWINDKDRDYDKLELAKVEVDEDGDVTVLKIIKTIY